MFAHCILAGNGLRLAEFQSDVFQPQQRKQLACVSACRWMCYSKQPRTLVVQASLSLAAPEHAREYGRGPGESTYTLNLVAS